MQTKANYLSDAAVRDFITKGYTLVQSDHSPEFHQDICQQLDEVLAREGNPGNNVLPCIPQIQQVFNSSAVRGLLESLLGPNYAMHSHRYCHLNKPGSNGQSWHKDDYLFDQNVRHHRFRWIMAFYYPQEVTPDMGPTGIIPGRQYHNTISNTDPIQAVEKEFKLCGSAGTVALVNFDAWHRATANTSDKARYMLKFQFLRMEEPRQPNWNHRDPAWDPIAGEAHSGLTAHVWDWLAARKGVAGEGGNGLTAKWFAALRDADEGRRLGAAYTLGAMGESAVPDLMKALHGEAQDLVEANQAKTPANGHGGNPAELSAAYALGATGTPAIPALIEALHHDHWGVRATAADVLGNTGRSAIQAAPDLARSLVDANLWVRRNAAEALGTIAPQGDFAIVALTKALKDGDDRIRRNAAFSLAKIGPAASGAVAGLRQTLADENRYVRYNAVLALQRIATTEAQTALWDELITARWCPITTKKTPY